MSRVFVNPKASIKNIIKFILQFLALNNHGKRVDTGRDVIEIDLLILDDNRRQCGSIGLDNEFCC